MSYWTNDIVMNEDLPAYQGYKIHQSKVIKLDDIKSIDDLEFNVVNVYENKPTYNCTLDFPNTKSISISYGRSTLYGAREGQKGYEVWVKDDIDPYVVNSKEVLKIINDTAREPAVF